MPSAAVPHLPAPLLVFKMMTRVLGRLVDHRLTPVGLVGLGYALQAYAIYHASGVQEASQGWTSGLRTNEYLDVIKNYS